VLGNKNCEVVHQNNNLRNNQLIKAKGKTDVKYQTSVENSLLMSPQTIREEYT
jgi:hypothetical protein